MSIAVLQQVYTETRRLSIAGSNLAVGDFRLKKLVEPLEKSSQKAPVFGAVAKAIDKLVTGPEQDSAQALLDLASFVLAILYTQGQTAVEGKPEPIQSKELSLTTTQMPARLIKPLIEALTATGGGRLETIKEGFERGAFDDIRLVNPAIRALDDTYSEIADFVTDNILPKYGHAIVPEIKDKIDIQGRAGNVRRLRLLHALAPTLARPIVLEAFEKGSKEMKIAALGCLGDCPEDLPHLLEQAEAKSKDVRRVALSRLGKFEEETCIKLLTKALHGADRELVTKSIRDSQNQLLWQTVLNTTNAELEELFKLKDKAKLDKALQRFDELLACYQQRTDKACIQQLATIHQRRDELKKLKGTPVSGSDVLATLCETMLCTGEKSMLECLVEDREQMQDDRFICTALAGLLTLSPTKFFDEYSKFYAAKPGKNKSGRSDSPRDALNSLLPTESGGRGGWYFFHRHMTTPEHLTAQLQKRSWDPRWLEVVIAADELQAAIGLGNAKHAGLKQYLLERLAAGIKKNDIDYDAYWALQAIVKYGYPEATQCWIDALNKLARAKTRYYYSSYFLAPLVAKLPKSSAPLVEAALQGKPESLVDEIMPHLVELKKSTAVS